MSRSERQKEIDAAWFDTKLAPIMEQLSGTGPDYLMCSPLREDKHPSFSANTEKGCYNDFATHEGGTFTELARRLGIEPPDYAGGGKKRKANAKEEQRREPGKPATPETLAALREVWDKATPLPADREFGGFQYLAMKKVRAAGLQLRISNGPWRAGWLLMPLFDLSTGQIMSLQAIAPGLSNKPGVKTEKQNYPGAPVLGLAWPAWSGAKALNAPFILCEGMATAASVAELYPAGRALCCVNADNIPNIAGLLDKAFPLCEIGIASDTGDAGEKAYQETVQGARDKKTGKLLKLADGETNERGPIPRAIKLIPRAKTAQGTKRVSLFGVETDIPVETGGYKSNTDWNDILLAKGLDAARGEFNKRLEGGRLLALGEALKNAKVKPDYINAAELGALDMPPQHWAVSGLIPAGLSVLASHGKKGKSWLALQMAAAVSEGDKFLGMDTEQGAVLYVGMESSRAETQGRLKALFGSKPLPNLTIATQFPRLDHGGIEELIDWIAESRPSLIILDVWQFFKPAARDKNLNAYELDYQAVIPLKAIANKTNTAILLLHHLKKNGADAAEMLEALSGSMGLPSAADSILCLKREGQADTATIERTGRDMADTSDIPITWLAPGWRLTTKEELAAAKLAEDNEGVRLIIQALKDTGAPMEPKAIIAATGLKQNTAYVYLRRLKAGGRLMQFSDGRYYFPDIEGRPRENAPAQEEEILSLLSRDDFVKGVKDVKGLKDVKDCKDDSLSVSGDSPQGPFQPLQGCKDFVRTLEAGNTKGSRGNSYNLTHLTPPEGEIPPFTGGASETLSSLAARSGASEADILAAVEGRALARENGALLPRIVCEGGALIVKPMPPGYDGDALDETESPAVETQTAPGEIEEACDV